MNKEFTHRRRGQTWQEGVDVELGRGPVLPTVLRREVKRRIHICLCPHMVRLGCYVMSDAIYKIMTSDIPQFRCQTSRRRGFS